VPDFAAALVAAFLPLFVAINIPGILPLYIGMTETFTADDRRQLLIRALLAALVLAVLMLFAGQVIFDTLGITLNDLRVGGGIILLVIAVTDLAFGDTKDRRGGKKKDREKLTEHEEGEPVDLPVVPLGIPLIIGPGAITTILITDGAYGWVVTLASIVLNMALVFVAFTFGPSLLRLFGPGTSKAVAKVASLFLAAISVAMIRAGVLGMIGAV
jgi:multiple antibiotic resistance protein